MKQTLKQIYQTLKVEFAVYRLAMHHPLTPKLAKFLLWLALGYLLLPFDLIPDFIPLIGQLDDVVIVPGLIYLALKMIPPEIMIECREQVRKEIT
ncbi:hypothetical protein A7981_02415 [Methylovorus sp. MM2]|nr:hypothetical protein A7981_02415 [Methylovorus sp. MM2]